MTQPLARRDVGVIAHLANPTIAQIRELAAAAEDAGADWLGVADAFWWRDTWMLLAEAARVTSRIQLGPMVTNPYLRHPFHTASAVATLQEVAGDRVFVGLSAGGSEVSGAAGISRSDAGRRITTLASLLRSVASGAPLDAASGRTLDVAMTRPTVLVAGRGDGVLSAGGRSADEVLLWAVPDSDLERSANVIWSAAAKAREDTLGERPRLVWAPLVQHGEADRARAKVIAAYGILNASAAVRAAWGVGEELVDKVRRALVGGGAEAAVGLVPETVVDDVLVTDPAPAAVARRAREIGATAIAFPAYDIDAVTSRVRWAREVLDWTRQG
jgi:5,10-methylenetetrahydromethanopterin reductase